MNSINDFNANTTQFNDNELKYILKTSIRFNNNLLNKDETTQWYDFCCEKSNNFEEYHKESINYNEIQTQIQILDDYFNNDFDDDFDDDTLLMGIGQAIKTEFYALHKALNKKCALKMMIILKAYDVMRLDRYKYHDYKKNTYVLIVETSTSKDLVAESKVNDILLDCKEHIKEGNIDNIKPIKDVWEAGCWWSQIELENDECMMVRLTIKKTENGKRIFDYLDNLIKKYKNN